MEYKNLKEMVVSTEFNCLSEIALTILFISFSETQGSLFLELTDLL